MLGADPDDIELRSDQSAHMVSAEAVEGHELSNAFAHVAATAAAMLVERGFEAVLQPHLQAFAESAEGAIKQRDGKLGRLLAVAFNGDKFGGRHGRLRSW